MKCQTCSTPLVFLRGPWVAPYAPLWCPTCRKVHPK